MTIKTFKANQIDCLGLAYIVNNNFVVQIYFLFYFEKMIKESKRFNNKTIYTIVTPQINTIDVQIIVALSN